MGAFGRLLYDPTKPASGSTVGAYVRSDDGTHITHTTVGSEEHLNVFGVLGDETGSPISAANPLDVSGTFAPTIPDDYAATQNPLSATEESLVASALADRCYMFIKNIDDGSGDPFEIVDTGNAYGTGFPLFPGEMLCMAAGASLDLKVIANTATTPTAATLELSCP